MTYIEFMATFEGILSRAVSRDVPAQSTMVSLFRACDEAVPDPRWGLLAYLRWDAELDAFAEWFRRRLESEPPDDSIEHWQFIVPDIESNPPEFVLEGHPRYDHRKGSPWSEGVQWPADDGVMDAYHSSLLAVAAAVVGCSPALRAQLESSESWATHLDESMPLLYAIPLAYGSLLTRHVAEAIGAAGLCPGGQAVRFTVTSSGGDDIDVGVLEPGGRWRAADQPPATP